MIDRRTIRTGLKVIAAVDSDVAGALGEAGLSRRKAEYATGLACTILDGRFDPATLAGLGDNEAIAAICTLHGFGRWSAEIYVMFSLQRPDVFPADDLALQRALQNLKGWSKRPAAAEAREAVVHWSPWRTVGSLFLWHLYLPRSTDLRAGTPLPECGRLR